jgi:hypothetical protein
MGQKLSQVLLVEDEFLIRLMTSDSLTDAGFAATDVSNAAEAHRILIVSGKARLDQKDLPHGSRFLAKPFDPHHAVAHLREIRAIPE